jgi:DNA-binding LacI/PurR family transcriptional regulator
LNFGNWMVNIRQSDIAKELNVSRVVSDDKPGAINSLNRIILEGYTKIANFSGYLNTNIGKKRLEGFIDSLTKNKIPIGKEWIIEGGFEQKNGYENQDPRKMGLEACKLLINEIEKKIKSGRNQIYIEEEFLWRKSVRCKVKK